MSDIKDINFQEHANKARELLEIRQKENEIRKHKAELQFQEIQEKKLEEEARKKLDITNPTPEYIEKIKNKTIEAFKSSKLKTNFIYNIPELNYVIPFFPKNLILLGAVSGEGKSTCAANIAYSQLIQGKKVLIVTNEESSEDTITRVASLFLNIRYGNIDRMKDSDMDKLVEMQQKLHSRLHVIDDNYGALNGYNLPSTTSSIEGLYFILDQLLEKQVKGFSYDVVILDYFQNFGDSRNNPSMKAVEVLTKAASRLDQFKNHYNAPIVVFAQLKNNPSPDKEIPAKERLEWCKGIVNRSTCFIEIKANRKEFTTSWILHKSRFNDFPENTIVTGWEKGKYVPVTPEFKDAILRKKLELIKGEKEDEKRD